MVFVRGSTESAGTGPATRTPSSNPYEEQRRQGLQTVLDAWAAAVRADDADALLPLFDVQAEPGFLDREIARAHNLAGVPLADWGFEIGSEPEQPVDPAVADALGAADVWTPPVYLRYAVAGPDTMPTRKPVALTVARRGDGWKLVSDAPAGGRTTWRGPWDFGPLTAVSVPTADGRTSVVLGHTDETVDALAAELATAVPAVSSLWGPGWVGSALVFAAASQEEFAALAGAPRSGLDVAAVSVSDAVTQGSPVTGQRIVFSPESADRLTVVTRRSVLRHELTHVAARAATVDGSPMWILEGFADYSGYRDSELAFARTAPTLARQVANGALPTSLPTDADFAAPESAGLAYETAWSACAYLAADFGERALVDLYRQLARGPVDEAGVDAAFRAVLGMGTADFLDGWRKWTSSRLLSNAPG
ncbi:hypothetical protein [Antrihabitans sp. YC2-6]|uniref:hypothetical protein n=1 Tax=Antrihabitans sp. YC2-6 TaxID=2799498 RepID=UPI0018F76F6B|nr:hypothetical protein [Antrihabitans sp. YC2-6]MBJ8343242.1 hypothetical protein [Antrihabitans sp. YC2-6]